MSDSDDILLDIAPSAFRRALALISLLVLGGVLIALAFGDVPDLWRLFFVGLGAFVLWSCSHLYRSTGDGLQLTPAGLRTRSGRMLVAAENIDRVERGVFAFKPSNGFLVRLKTPEDRGWAPGLWWKFGRRLGVGGTLSGGQTRAMADLMAAMVVERG
ncbi:MAG: hypothetical protein OIF48_19970 [Silicimonas sp.]|nr:hypothetical protein [Silicimonas sp.]